ncbi:sugar phosphate isomerase/epimerase family protein [Pseudovibrio sp. SPO723]|uniref:sugar phosphate isomerase/epimerase family protein n=1 Tax=Nesiotobacter zosterae TaxID=392721 RepID=UPI0029C22A59|nr:sugar phosphate isomerase/epimerase family protein [Pseudovibrio sp. SPO723]MDX5593410.1 sugar phosphate isomerase/epimerase family protein [Pseudovibrio sp. SPO723]
MRVLEKNSPLLSLNTASLGHRSPISEVIERAARHGFGSIVPWRRDLEGCEVHAVARQIKDAGLKVNGLCRSTYFPQETEQTRRAALEDNKRALETAALLGADCYILVVGSLPAGSRDLASARRQVKDGVAELMETARELRVPLALEPLHPMTAGDRSCLNTLGQALDWCEALDPHNSGDLGVALDVYHLWWDEYLERDIARAGKQNRILGFHVSDWLVPTTDLVQDRGMMGDGVVDLRQIRRWVEAAGYAGPVEVEIFSKNNWWLQNEDDVLSTCIDRMTTVC